MLNRLKTSLTKLHRAHRHRRRIQSARRACQAYWAKN